MSIVLREAKIIDNVDPNETGKVQIRVLPEMNDFAEDVLPWVAVYSSNDSLSTSNGTHTVYEIGSLVRVIIEDFPFIKKVRIISSDYVEGLYVYQNCDLTGITELSTQSYPQPSFKMFADGTIMFHNSDTGETGILYSDGSYNLTDSDGKTYVNSKNDMDVTTTGDITASSSGSITITGVTVQITGGSLQVDGSVTPTGSGALCGLPYCLYTGAPQTGNIATST